MVIPTGSAFVLAGQSSDGDDAYWRRLPKNPGLTGNAISGVVVADGGDEFLGALGLNSAALGCRFGPWACYHSGLDMFLLLSWSPCRLLWR